jgi:diguanylate cyclase (GGDEF)-like protein
VDALKLTIGTDKVVIKDWMETGSVVLKVLAINPSKEESQEVPIKTYLPAEAKPENVLNRDELDIRFDPERSLYFVEKKVMLKPGESYTLHVHIDDIWLVPEPQLAKTRERAANALKALEGTASYDVAKLLHDNVAASLDMIAAKQSDESLSPQEHIAAYRAHVKVMDETLKDLATLEGFVVSAAQSSPLASKKGGASAGFGFTSTWKLMLAIVAFLAMLSLASFFVWQRQLKAMTLEKEINMLAPEERPLAQNKLIQSATRDELTGLFNAASFRRLLADELKRSRLQKGSEVTVLMLDLDFFKKINDTFGHAAGDHVLQRTADLLRAGIKRSEAAFRYGGDEFMVLAPGLSAADAMKVAERLRKTLQESQFLLGEQKTPYLATCSLGVATFDGKETPEELIKRVDTELYQAKKRRPQPRQCPHSRRGMTPALPSVTIR